VGEPERIDSVAASERAGARRTQALPSPAAYAHVSTLSFVASRAVAPAGFPLALAGGVALARCGQLRSARESYGAALGALVETAAIVGPTRLGGPITQALTAPLIGRGHARGTPLSLQILAVAGLRFIYNAGTSAFFIWVLSGGIDAYTGTYEATAGSIPGLPTGPVAAVVLTLVAIAAWALIAATIGVLTAHRAIERWPPGRIDRDPGAGGSTAPEQGRFDPRAVVAAAVIAFVLLLASVAWPLLAAVGLWLAAVWALERPDPRLIPAGLVLAATLALSTGLITLIGGDGAEAALAHAARAAMLVAVATWLRGAIGARGFREVGRRMLRRVRRIPAAAEAAQVLAQLGPERTLGASARSLAGAINRGGRGVRRALAAALDWIAAESERFRGSAPAPALVLHAGAPDLLLCVTAALPVAALALW
jgi:hypothetical protein